MQCIRWRRCSKIEILDWLYPRRCALCDGLLKNGEQGCCNKCDLGKYKVLQPMCYKCGKPLNLDDEEYCKDCVRYEKHFIVNRSLYRYGGQIQTSMMMLKYKGRREYAEFFGKEIVDRYGKQILAWNADAILPVPVHTKRKRMRGYNQAELIANGVGKRLNIPVITDVLLRTEYTIAQKELTPLERLKNLESAFQFQRNSVKLEQVIVVDDIYTTGATLEACSRVLLDAGVKKVYGITVAIGEGY